MEKIDFVILWVDGNDPKWQKEKEKYCHKAGDQAQNRFRDFNNLQYWFRGVEKFAPWVNKIYFVTWGHVPKWLNVNHPKLRIVKHEDFIAQEYLPLFNSCAIEMNLFRIKELSEKFVYFNDDIFIINKLKPSDFFKNNQVKDIYYEVNLDLTKENKYFKNVVLNNYKIVNKYFNKRQVYLKHPLKYFNIKYGLLNNLRTLKESFKKDFHGICNPHLAQPYLKSEFLKVYNLEKEAFIKTYHSKFRDELDISQYLVRYFQLLSGNFYPSFSKGKVFNVNNPKFISYIKEQKGKMVCLNDSEDDIDFTKCQKNINDALDYILGEKSSYEK